MRLLVAILLLLLGSAQAAPRTTLPPRPWLSSYIPPAIARDTGGSTFPITASSQTQTTTTAGITTSAANTLCTVTVGSGNTDGTDSRVSTVAWSGGSGCSATFSKQCEFATAGNFSEASSIWTASCSTQLTGRAVEVMLATNTADQITVVAVDCLVNAAASANCSGQAGTGSTARSATLSGVLAGSWIYVAAMSETCPLSPVASTTELLEANNGVPNGCAASGVNNTGTSGSVNAGWSSSAAFSAAAALEIKNQ